MRAMLRQLSSPWVVISAAVALGAAAGHVSRSTVQIWSFVAINIILTQSINLLTGLAGQISLGQAAFFGLGAYGSALLMRDYGVPLQIGRAHV